MPVVDIGNKARYGLPEDLGAQLARVLHEHSGESVSTTRRSGKSVSWKTEEKRVMVMNQAIRELIVLGYRLQKLERLSETHIQALVSYWEGLGHAVGTIDGRLSILRTLAKWLGKPGMVKHGRIYAAVPEEYTRSHVAEEDKSWEGNGIEVLRVLERIRSANRVVAMHLELQWAFGIRVEESFLLRPEHALREAITRGAVGVTHGTKGGRARTVTVEDVVQIDVLTRASSLVVRSGGTMIPAKYTLEQWRKKYYYILSVHGVMKKLMGVTSHGLRHQYLHQVWEKITGELAPVKGGEAAEEGLAAIAMAAVVERAGHYDARKSKAYLGNPEILKKINREK